MKKMRKNKKWVVGLMLLTCSLIACAYQVNQNTIYADDAASISLKPIVNNNEPVLLDKKIYQQTVNVAKEKIQKIINNLSHTSQNHNIRIRNIVSYLKDIPYQSEGAMGEGDWVPSSLTYQPGALHLKQDPVYRLDGLDCQTFVQVVMALLHANNLLQFEKNLIGIAYGAANTHQKDYLHYYNRNNFIDGDFNPVNESRGNLEDVTSKGALSVYAKTTSANITRQNWFDYQRKNKSNLRLLSLEGVKAMKERFMTTYAALPFPNFVQENVIISYIPKTTIAIPKKDGGYFPNKQLLTQIPLPAIAEIVRDVKKWNINGQNIKTLIGSELTVSHLGILYRQTFRNKEVIYHDIQCTGDRTKKTICTVHPVVCKQTYCKEVMFAHATYAYPNDYFWYKKENGQFVCTKEPPASGQVHSKCNRVEQLPLFAYLAHFNYGTYPNMVSPSILGIHIEKLL